MNQKLFKPSWDAGITITNIPHESIISKGIKAILLDVDGTLLPRKELNVHKSVKEWIFTAKKNFKVHLISNNPSKRRIGNIAMQLNSSFTYSAGNPGTKALLKSIKSIDKPKKELAIIGDRIFTDVIAGNRLGIYTILVKPIGSNGKTIENSKVQFIENKVSSIIGALNL